MKKIILVLIGILILSCSNESKTKHSTIYPNIILNITENTTKNDLVKIASEFKTEQNVILDFSKTEFYENGKIKSLSYKLKFKK